MTGFRSHTDELERLGVNLVFIGNGNALMATDFREKLGLDVPVWVDPKKVTYAHLGLKNSVFSALGPQVWAHGLRAWRAGFRQQRTQGDPFQQGGVLVVRRGGEIEFSYVSEEAGDHPPLDRVMSSARRIGRGPEALAR